MYNEHMLFELHPTLCLHCEQNFDQKCKWSQYEYNESVPHQYLVLPLMITNTINYTESKKRERQKKNQTWLVLQLLCVLWNSWHCSDTADYNWQMWLRSHATTLQQFLFKSIPKEMSFSTWINKKIFLCVYLNQSKHILHSFRFKYLVYNQISLNSYCNELGLKVLPLWWSHHQDLFFSFT